MSDPTGYLPLAELLAKLDYLGYLFKTQGVAGDEFVPWQEIVADLKHGDMAEMLSWDAAWNRDAMAVIVTAPQDALESPGATVEIYARHTTQASDVTREVRSS